MGGFRCSLVMGPFELTRGGETNVVSGIFNGTRVIEHGRVIKRDLFGINGLHGLVEGGFRRVELV